MSIDPFTPAQEPRQQLADRTVGRADVRAWLRDGCRSFLDGKQGLHQLLVGGRGMGKSHLAQMLRYDLGRDAPVRWISEDIPLLGRAELLLKRMGSPTEPTIVLFEGLDLQMGALSDAEQWSLRQLLDEYPVHLVGTALSNGFAAGQDGPFFGQLDTWRLGPLPPNDAIALFESISGGSAATQQAAALIELSEQNPRPLIAFASALGPAGDANSIAEAVHRAFHQLASDLRERFRGLPPLGQRMIELLALSGEVRAGSVALQLGVASGSVSKVATQLEEEGLLVRESDPQDGRSSIYRTRDLTRLLYRYQSLDHETGGLQAVAGLLMRVLGPDDLVELWHANPRSTLGQAAGQASTQTARSFRALRELTPGTTEEEARQVLQRVHELELQEYDLWMWMERLAELNLEAAWDALGPAFERSGWAKALHRVLASRGFDQAQHAVSRLIQELAEEEVRLDAFGCWMALQVVQVFVERLKTPHFQGIEISPGLQGALGTIPHFRVRWSVAGLVPGTPALRPWPPIRISEVAPQTPDLRELLSASIQMQDATIFERCVDVLIERAPGGVVLPYQPVPERIAPDVVAAGRLISSADEWSLDWAASLVGIPEQTFQAILENVVLCSSEADLRAPDREARALTTLFNSAHLRFELLAQAFYNAHGEREVFDAVRALNTSPLDPTQPLEVP